MRFAAVLTVLLALVALSSAITLSKAHPSHTSGKHAVKKAHKEAKSKAKGEAKKAASEHSLSHKKETGKKSHKKNSLKKHTSQLVQAKAHEEEFGTTGGGGEEPQQTAPPPAAPAAAPSSSPGGKSAAVWSGELNSYGPCLRDFASLVDKNECVQDKLGDVEYFLKTVDQEEHTLSAGYKTGMARKAMIIEGIGMNASSSEATPLTRHAFQRSRVELAYACAPAGSECKSYMTPVGEIDASIGKDKQCPTKLMQGSDDPHVKAMRGRMLQIMQAYGTNPDAYFWGDSRQYAAAVAVCFYIRTYGEGGSQTSPPGMLLKDNIYDPAPAGTVDLEEQGEGGDVAMPPPPSDEDITVGEFPQEGEYHVVIPAELVNPALVAFVKAKSGDPALNGVAQAGKVLSVPGAVHESLHQHMNIEYEKAVFLAGEQEADSMVPDSKVAQAFKFANAFTWSVSPNALATIRKFDSSKIDEWGGALDAAAATQEDFTTHKEALTFDMKKWVKAVVAIFAVIFDEFKKDTVQGELLTGAAEEGSKHVGDALEDKAKEHALDFTQNIVLSLVHTLETLDLVHPHHAPAHHAVASFLGGTVSLLLYNIGRVLDEKTVSWANTADGTWATAKGALCGSSGAVHLAISGSITFLSALNFWHGLQPACTLLAKKGIGDPDPACNDIETSFQWGRCLAKCTFMDSGPYHSLWDLPKWTTNNIKLRVSMDLAKIDVAYCWFQQATKEPCDGTMPQDAYQQAVEAIID